MGISKAKKGVIHRAVYKDGTVVHRHGDLSTGLSTEHMFDEQVFVPFEVKSEQVFVRTSVRFPWAGVPQLFENSVRRGGALH